MPCLNCGKPTRNPKYCTNRCQRALTSAAKIAEIEATQSIPSKSPRLARRYLVAVRGHRCELCQIERWQDQRVLLVLDHVDGNADNWVLANLRLICPNSDALLPTFKSRNRGRGRAWRRKRYADGRSY